MNKELNSIGINKKPSETTVVVAMSGGVDSSTVAGIMKNEGYKVIGITLKLYDDGKEVAKSKQCCSGQQRASISARESCGMGFSCLESALCQKLQAIGWVVSMGTGVL